MEAFRSVSVQAVFPKLPIIPSTIYYLAECRYDDHTSFTASSQLVTGYDDCTYFTASSQLVTGYNDCTASSQLVTRKTQSCINTKLVSLPSHNHHQSESMIMFVYKNWFQYTADTDCYTLLKDSKQH